MKLRKIKDKKTLLGAMWYIMFEAKYVARWTMHVAYYGTTLLFGYLVYLNLMRQNWLFVCLFGVLFIAIVRKTYQHYLFTKHKMYTETLGELYDKYKD